MPASASASAAVTEPPAGAPVVPPGTSLRAAVEIDARSSVHESDEPAPAETRPAHYTDDPPYAPADVLETVRTIPPGAQARKLGRRPLGAPPPPPPPSTRRPLGVPPPLPGAPPRRITPKMFAAVVDVAEVAAAESYAQKKSTAPPPPIAPTSETPPPGPTEPTPESIAKWLALADPGLRALVPQRRPASEALEKLVSG